MLNKFSSSEFNSYIRRFQGKYDDVTYIDSQGRTAGQKIENYVKIFALTSQIQELKILFSEQLKE